MPLSLTLSRQLLVGAALLGAALPATLAQNIEVNKDNRTVSVTATERITVTADVATVHIGFVTYGHDRDSAYSAGIKLSNDIIAALTSTGGITMEAIESDSQGIEPTQNYQIERLSAAEAAARKYQVQQSWLVHVPAAAAAKTLDTAVLAGANQSGQIDWGLRDENSTSATAAARAISRAHRTAQQMVSPFGGKVGALLFASNESESTNVRPVPIMAQHKAMDAREPLAITPRRIERAVTVHAIFAIE